MNTGEYQNSISTLPNVRKYKFENIFKVHTHNDQYFYNILKTINVPAILKPDMYYTCKVSTVTPLTNLSYMHYGTIDLWWLICITNKINNPIQFLTPGSTIKVIKSKHVDKIVSIIKNSLES